MATATVLFNASRNRFFGFEAGDRMVKSHLFVGHPVSDDTFTNMAEQVFMDGNRDDRINGATETSVSVGDVILLHTRDGDIPMAVASDGFVMLSPEDWESAEIVAFDERVMLEPDRDKALRLNRRHVEVVRAEMSYWKEYDRA